MGCLSQEAYKSTDRTIRHYEMDLFIAYRILSVHCDAPAALAWRAKNPAIPAFGMVWNLQRLACSIQYFGATACCRAMEMTDAHTREPLRMPRDALARGKPQDTVGAADASSL